MSLRFSGMPSGLAEAYRAGAIWIAARMVEAARGDLNAHLAHRVSCLEDEHAKLEV
ncbi:MAG: hypothetical protein HY834_11595 [Devosia nanyangense]|uniref:Uncharacterized protein n=1 Tax=Devosia nanyangense TaxID=1228055 RepID=A0A933NYK8_9HYPH|nr:hypothetical protein [Devosia nanyangense]